MKTSAQYRPDIQGLRAIAVTAVILGHIFPSIFTGGFIGVDIFFVISGFVITHQMTKLHQKSSKGFLVEFYSRRIKRILPTALLVTISSILAAGYFLGPVAANQSKLDAAWVTIFLGNFHFNHVAVDYFSTGIQTSALQHYWSLSIEEQFYLLWPALFLLLFTFIRKQSLIIYSIASLCALSLMTAMYQSEISLQPIFFMSFTRIWELTAGALLALGAYSFRIPRILIVISLGIYISGFFTIVPTMQWPNLTSIPIILSTLLLLVNNTRVAPIKFLSNKTLVYIGDLSYVLYLWHWPILTIYKGYSPTYGNIEKFITLLITLIASIATHHFIENPVRFSKKFTPKMNILLGIASIFTISSILFISYQG